MKYKKKEKSSAALSTSFKCLFIFSGGGVESETASVNGEAESEKSGATSSSKYPFTTSQLEAAYLTNQLLRLHPEEFKKLMSLERSRQATLRWQFSSDPFDSVHEHQSLPYEIAMLASQEPRVQQGQSFFLCSFILHPIPNGCIRGVKIRSRLRISSNGRYFPHR